MEKIKIGISSCLLGNKVRFDGQHKQDRYIAGTLSQYCDFIPVCPEVECGLAVPRESMHLVGTVESPRLLTGRTGIDHTDRMTDWAQGKLDLLEKENLVAFIFKSASPSSGLRDIKIYREDGNVVSRAGRGLFAAAFTRRFPDIPVEDEGRLNDPVLRENFVETIFTLQRWRSIAAGLKASDLVAFHTAHKYALMSHSQDKAAKLGRIAASVSGSDIGDAFGRYRHLLGETLQLRKTRKKIYNVLLHIVGYFKKNLDPREKSELLSAAERYYSETAPLIVPLTLINHYVMKYEQPYLKVQTFLSPHPVEMGLLNHV